MGLLGHCSSLATPWGLAGKSRERFSDGIYICVCVLGAGGEREKREFWFSGLTSVVLCY